jgi:glycine/D-amino acid oxidase-like deaminating enzyme
VRTVDVLVVGAGLAGLHTGRLLAAQGLGVLVVDRRRSLSAGIRTTGIFVRRTFDDFDLPDHLLGPGVRDMLLYPPSRRAPIRLTSDRDEYRVADMAAVYQHAHRAAESAGVPSMRTEQRPQRWLAVPGEHLGSGLAATPNPAGSTGCALPTLEAETLALAASGARLTPGQQAREGITVQNPPRAYYTLARGGGAASYRPARSWLGWAAGGYRAEADE